MGRLRRGRGWLALAAGLGLLAGTGCAGPELPAGLGSACDKGEIAIATELPVSGADGAVGRPAEQGARFAVQQHPCSHGFRLSVRAYDDAVDGRHNPRKGTQNVELMRDDPAVLGIVGPLNSNVVAAALPVANQASLAMVSPGATVSCLTLDLDHCRAATGFTPATLRPTGSNTFFRVAAPYVAQGTAMADFAYDSLHVTRAAAFSDAEAAFGREVKDSFVAEFQRRGGTVVATAEIGAGPSAPDFRPFLQQAAAGGAQAVYAGGTSGGGACLAYAEGRGVLDAGAYFLGPDAIADPRCLHDAGDTAGDRLYASFGWGDAAHHPAAAGTVAAYRKAYPQAEAVGAFTFSAYDGAQLLVDAIGRAIAGNGGRRPTRSQVLAALTMTDGFAGLTGTFSFTADGDPRAPVIQVVQSRGADWAYARQFAIST